MSVIFNSQKVASTIHVDPEMSMESFLFLDILFSMSSGTKNNISELGMNSVFMAIDQFKLVVSLIRVRRKLEGVDTV